MQAQFANLNIVDAHRFSAVSFNQLENIPPPENFKDYAMAGLQRKNEDANAVHQIKAMWACLNSHVGAIEFAKSRGWPYVLILEDDCEFEFYTNKVMTQVSEQIKNIEWDMLYLGGNQKKHGKRVCITKNLLSVTGITLAHAYIVNATIYDKILLEAPKGGMTIDDFYTKSLQNEIKTLLVNPPVAFQAPDEISDISQVARRKKYNLTHFTRAFKRFFARARYLIEARI
jgi:glycosyl transferase family 25